mmetsp:Transcript_57988/g.164767  ORF Transcript_57988/g.164767 Transcript_57988/m.164767 type:complete len:146 (-) Transcript_57988:235-672(-)
MPRDLMLGIFGDDGESPPPEKEQRDVFPFYEDRGNGCVLPHHFDNDKAIELYEENLQDLVEAAGMKHQGVIGNALGLIALYDMKAGIDKDAKYYDKAIEYIDFTQRALIEMAGPHLAPLTPVYQDVENRRAKLLRKRERRLAKKG